MALPVQHVAGMQVLNAHKQLPHQQPDVMCCEGLLEAVQVSPVARQTWSVHKRLRHCMRKQKERERKKKALKEV